jgi:SAM-dependent methyltransferase
METILRLTNQLLASNTQSEVNEILNEIASTFSNSSPHLAEQKKDFQERFMKQSFLAERILSSSLLNSKIIDLLWDLRNNLNPDATSLGQRIEAFLLDMDLAKGVEYRIKYLANKIENYRSCKIASIASGSAIELAETMGFNKNEYYAYDIDARALARAQLRDIPNLTIHKMDCTKFKSDLKFDLIYSAGLFDYFTEEQSKSIIANLFDHLNEGGQLIIGNADINVTGQAIMNELLNWKLIYKSKEQLIRMAGDISKDISIHTDPFAAFNYLTLTK